MADITKLIQYAVELVKPPKAKGAPKWDTIGAASAVRDVEEAVKVTAAVITAAINEANEGDPRNLASLASDLVDRDASTSASMRTRRLAVLSCPWQIAAIDAKDAERAKEIEKMLKKSGIDSLIGSLADAAWYGYSGSSIEWGQEGYPVRYVKIHPTRWVFDMAGNPAISLSTAGGDKDPIALAGAEYGRYVFAAPATSMAPHKSGLCRSVAWLWMFKHNAWLWRSRYIERFGMPILQATIPQSQYDNADEKAKLSASLSTLGSKGHVIVPESTGLQFVSAIANASNADYEKYIDNINDEITIAILGQKATSGDAGGLSKGQAQENVRLDILAADCRMVMESIQRHLIDPLVAFTLGESAAGMFEFMLDYQPPDDKSAKALVLKTLFDAGLEADEEWAAAIFEMPLSRKAASAPAGDFGQQPDMDAEDGGETPAKPSKAQKNANGGGSAKEDKEDSGEGKLMAMSDLSPRPESAVARDIFLSRVSGSALDRLIRDPRAAAEFLSPLKKEISKAFAGLSPDDPDLAAKFAEASNILFQRYPTIYEAMGASSKGFEQVFHDAILTAAAGQEARQ
jgi:phage gp29-like protein